MIIKDEQEFFMKVKEDVLVLAQTIYGEARGEWAAIDGGLAALIAVGNVVMNRLQNGRLFGTTIRDVCLKPYQFSCWTDLNRTAIQKAEGPVWALCKEVAEGVALREWPDLTKGATHYYADSLAIPPYWAKGQCVRVKIGHHLFFKI